MCCCIASSHIPMHCGGSGIWQSILDAMSAFVVMSITRVYFVYRKDLNLEYLECGLLATFAQIFRNFFAGFFAFKYFCSRRARGGSGASPTGRPADTKTDFVFGGAALAKRISNAFRTRPTRPELVPNTSRTRLEPVLNLSKPVSDVRKRPKSI